MHYMDFNTTHHRKPRLCLGNRTSTVHDRAHTFGRVLTEHSSETRRAGTHMTATYVRRTSASVFARIRATRFCRKRMRFVHTNTAGNGAERAKRQTARHNFYLYQQSKRVITDTAWCCSSLKNDKLILQCSGVRSPCRYFAAYQQTSRKCNIPQACLPYLASGCAFAHAFVAWTRLKAYRERKTAYCAPLNLCWRGKLNCLKECAAYFLS